MTQPAIPGPTRQARIHFINEWIEHRGLSQADVCRDLGVNKGTVSKWCSGDLPSEDNIRRLAALLEIDPIALFRHPHDDWMARFFQNRREDELSRMIEVLKAAFPRDANDEASRDNGAARSGARRR